MFDVSTKKKNPQPTHTGVVRRAGLHCLGNDYTVELFEAKAYWRTKHTQKFDKTSGYPKGEKFPAWRLDVTTIKPIK